MWIEVTTPEKADGIPSRKIWINLNAATMIGLNEGTAVVQAPGIGMLEIMSADETAKIRRYLEANQVA